MKVKCSILIIILLLFFCLPIQAYRTSENVQSCDNDQLIYGKVTTRSGSYYQGFLRWDTEEGTWTCLFQGRKSDHHNNKRLQSSQPSKDKTSLSDINWSFSSIWDDKVDDAGLGQFACEFGVIKSMTLYGSDEVTLEFINGFKLDLESGNTDDIGVNIIVEDEELGRIELEWETIKRIDFFKAPESLKAPYTPLFGKAYTIEGYEFKGLIRWDNDERMSSDILNGSCDCSSNKLKIKMDKISSITNLGESSRIKFKSGRTIEMYDSNDVDSENRGIHIMVKNVGEINIPWKEFDRIEFTEQEKCNGYHDYQNIRKINGTVTTKQDQTYKGVILYDLDENWSYEILDGYSRGLEYKIPFYNIKEIKKRNSQYCLITLKNNQELILGKTRDIGEKNNGLLVKNNYTNKTDFIKWEDVDKITFQR